MKKKTNKIKIDKYFGRRLLAIIILFLIIFFICSIIFKRKDKLPDLTVLYNNELLTLKNNVIVENENKIYFSKEDVKEIFDNNIYYNEAEKELITTYNKHVALLKVDENYMMVNDSHIDLNAKLIEQNNKVYLPINDLSIVYDIEIEYSENNNRIIIDSTLNEKTKAKVNKKVNVKLKTGMFSKKVEKLNKDDLVYILEKSEKYTKIRTQNGNIGYIKNKRIYEEEKIRDKWEENVKEINVLTEYAEVSVTYEAISLDKEKLNAVMPTFFYLDENQKVLDKTNSSSDSFKGYINWANTNEISVIPMLKNNASVSKSLLTYSQRNNVINQLYEKLVTNGLKGININFETIDDINSFYRFIIELAPKFKESGLKVCVTMNKNINKEKIENVVDYIIEEKK